MAQLRLVWWISFWISLLFRRRLSIWQFSQQRSTLLAKNTLCYTIGRERTTEEAYRWKDRKVIDCVVNLFISTFFFAPSFALRRYLAYIFIEYILFSEPSQMREYSENGNAHWTPQFNVFSTFIILICIFLSIFNVSFSFTCTPCALSICQFTICQKLVHSSVFWTLSR